ncbi:MAG: hypothetical protein JSS60_09670 [Verrucomicrobia bacterium]|nr:hypothetical protein [Verrucomicrobiota bacterium]
MKMKILLPVSVALIATGLFAQEKHHRRLPPVFAESHTFKNNIPPRYQWNSNCGYCGEVSLISAGLYFGQYVSQYDSREIATRNTPQYKGQLLIGKNDLYAARQMHLNAIEWDTDSEQSTHQFLAWVKQNIVKGYPVAIGIYTNEFLFYGNPDPHAGDADYDHIVPVIGIGSNHPLGDPSYYSDDILYFSDNGLWGDPHNPPYHFSYSFGPFQASRVQANAKNGPIYSIANDASNYGIAITGVMDVNGDTLPVRLDTSVNDETPEITDGSNTRPAPKPLTLTITVSGLQPGIKYNLYRYSDFASVPDSQFNAHASQASQRWSVQTSSGTSFVLAEQILSDEVAVYRCVRATAP